MFEDQFTQSVMMGENAPFEEGLSGSVGGEVNVDGTPMRLATIVVVGIIVLILFNQSGFRFHVTV